MLAKTLISAIRKRGGIAELRDRGTNGRGDALGYEVVGFLNGHDVHMFGVENDYYTVRHVSRRGYYDPYADYNSGGDIFVHRIKSLDTWCPPLANRAAEGKWTVGITETCTRLAHFDTHDECAQFIETLPDYEDGRYYIDGPVTEESEDEDV